MKILLQALILLGCFSVTAQNKLSGIITDMHKEPLFGVEIYAAESHKGTTTNEKGEYILKNLPNGKVKILFSYLGFQSQTHRLFCMFWFCLYCLLQ